MATGHVYFISTECKSKVKIGLTTSENPSARLSAIQVGCPYKLELSHSIECHDIDPVIVERDLHNIFGTYRLHGEWFEVAGSLAYFMHEAVSHGKHTKAKGTVKPAGAWMLLDNEGLATSGGVMGRSRVSGNPYSLALYSFKKEKDSVLAENAALRIILNELIEQTALMGAALNAIKQATRVVDDIESSFSPTLNEVSGRSAAWRIVKKSDHNRDSLDYAHSKLMEEDDFFGNALFYTDSPSERES